MTVTILAVGDVVSEAGLDYLSRNLRRVKREQGADFTVVNGENAAGIGLNPSDAQAIFDAGADVITLGNHTWGKIRITGLLDSNDYILRPANFARRTPGRGAGPRAAARAVSSSVILASGRRWRTAAGRTKGSRSNSTGP